jgi:hypothetical protein
MNMSIDCLVKQPPNIPTDQLLEETFNLLISQSVEQVTDGSNNESFG